MTTAVLATLATRPQRSTQAPERSV
jgi:aubergine